MKSKYGLFLAKYWRTTTKEGINAFAIEREQQTEVYLGKAVTYNKKLTKLAKKRLGGILFTQRVQNYKFRKERKCTEYTQHIL
jgi:hypothetical protein